MATPVLPVLTSAPWLGFPGLAWDVTQIPTYRTTKQLTMTGRSSRVTHYASPLYKFHFVFNVLRDHYDVARNVAKAAPFNEFETLLGFFLQRYGSGQPFFITVLNDKAVTNQTIIASTPAATTDYQMVRTLGGFTAPVGGINAVSELRVNTVPTGGFTINSPYDGWIRFSSAPATAAIIAADFTYYHKVAFEADALEFHTSMVDRWEARKVNLETVR